MLDPSNVVLGICWRRAKSKSLIILNVGNTVSWRRSLSRHTRFINQAPISQTKTLTRCALFLFYWRFVFTARHHVCVGREKYSGSSERTRVAHRSQYIITSSNCSRSSLCEARCVCFPCDHDCPTEYPQSNTYWSGEMLVYSHTMLRSNLHCRLTIWTELVTLRQPSELIHPLWMPLTSSSSSG